jgi:AraC family transcriptional regulator
MKPGNLFSHWDQKGAAMSSTTLKVELIDLAAQPTLTMRAEVAPEALSAKLAEILPAVYNHILAQRLQPAGAPFTRYLSMTDVFQIEAGLPVASPAVSRDAIQASELPAGPTATTLHVGPYDKLGDAHEALWQWAEANGYTPAGGGWESYITDPGEEPDPNKWQTQVFLPLRKR